MHQIGLTSHMNTNPPPVNARRRATPDSYMSPQMTAAPRTCPTKIVKGDHGRGPPECAHGMLTNETSCASYDGFDPQVGLSNLRRTLRGRAIYRPRWSPAPESACVRPIRSLIASYFDRRLLRSNRNANGILGFPKLCTTGTAQLCKVVCVPFALVALERQQRTAINPDLPNHIKE